MSNFIFNNKIKALNPLEQEAVHESFWQSPLWVDILTGTNQAEVIVASNGTVQIIIERRKIWKKFTGLYILGVDPGFITDEFLGELKKTLLTPTDLFLQIEPLEKMKNEKGRMKKFAPFRRFIEPVTALLDLTLPETELMASFAEKGRYNIRLAQKRGITTKWVKANETTNYKLQTTNQKDAPSSQIEDGRLKIKKTYIEYFYNLLDETTKRDGFAHNSLAYYQHFAETLESHNAGGLLVAEKDGVLHAAGIFAYWGDTAIYYYGASSSDTAIRRDMATYLLQWDAIREGIKRGCKTYDFLGISADRKGKLAGVTEFKLRFNPEKKYWMSERVMIFKPVTLFLLQCVSHIRKLFR